MAKVALVSVGGARLDQRTDLGAFQVASRWLHFIHGRAREADIADFQFPAIMRSRIADVSKLGEAEGYGQRCFHRHSHDRAGVRVHSRGDVNRGYWNPAVINQIHSGARQTANFRIKTRAKDGVDNHAGPGFESPTQAGFVFDLLDRSAGVDKVGTGSRAVAFKRLDGTEQYGGYLRSRLFEPSRRDHTVAAVVALARDDQDSMGEGGHRSPSGGDFIGDRLASAGHQGIGRHAVFLLAEEINLTALCSG